MCGQDSVLIGRTCPTHQLERAEVCRQEGQTGDPRRHLAPSHEEVFPGICKSLKVEAYGQNQSEVEGNDDYVNRSKMDEANRYHKRNSEAVNQEFPLGFGLSISAYLSVSFQDPLPPSFKAVDAKRRHISPSRLLWRLT